MSLIYLGNSDAKVLELLKFPKEMFCRYYIYGDVVSKFKF